MGIASDEKISVCVPTYEMAGRGLAYLDIIVQTLRQQTYKNFELIVSDHSKDDTIAEYARTIKDIPIIYTKNNYKRGCASANMNNAINCATGGIIKPIFQDDFIYDTNTLYFINQAINQYAGLWGATGFCHIDEHNVLRRELSNCFQTPFWNHDIVRGVNTVGCPSVIHFTNFFNDNPRFDESIFWLMDTDFYQQLYGMMGNGTFINNYLMAIRIWESSVTAGISDELKDAETAYIAKKWNL